MNAARFHAEPIEDIIIPYQLKYNLGENWFQMKTIYVKLIDCVKNSTFCQTFVISSANTNIILLITSLNHA
jgi:hypothetical protein